MTVCVMTVWSGVAELTLNVEVVPKPLLALANNSVVVLEASISVEPALPRIVVPACALSFAVVETML